MDRLRLGASWVASRFRSLSPGSIRGRLRVLFVGLIAMAICFAIINLLAFHRMAIRGSTSLSLGQLELEKGTALRGSVFALEAHGTSQERRIADLQIARHLLGLLDKGENAHEYRTLLERAHRHLDAYSSATLGAGSSTPMRRKSWQELNAASGAILDFQQLLLYRKAEQLRDEFDRGLRHDLLMLVLFIVLLVSGGLKSISIVTGPLAELARQVDSIRFDEELPTIPQFEDQTAEVSRVAKSFHELIDRLKGYRTVNFRRLLMEKRRADVIAASVSDGIYLLRGDEIVFANPVGELVLGIPKSISIRGLHLNRMSADSDSVTPGVTAVATAISRMMPVEFEFTDPQGRRSVYLVQSYPITVELIEQVEHSFDRRMAELMDSWSGNTIVIARDITIIRESREAKSHFLATLSHEVKTPVTSLTMATRLLQKAVDQFPNPMHRQLISSCAEDVERLRKLLDELLTVSQFDILAQKLELKRINFIRFIRQSIQFFQPQAYERGVEISSDVAADLRRIEIRIDPSKISWALSNLITNALRHTPKGGRVRVSVSSPRDDQVVVSVRDTGPGIEKVRQDRIFERFSAYYDLRVGRSGSVGMGLAIAREIITAHGGRIWLESEPGNGSEFSFSLPICGLQENPKGEFSGASARS